MPHRAALRGLSLSLTIAAALAVMADGVVSTAPSATRRNTGYVADVDGIIQPVTAEFMLSAIDRADRDEASILIFRLNTPGGLVESTQTIVARMLSAHTPIAVFVGPGGARAASAGFILVIAADIAAMAPGTHMGAAHPVTVGPEGASKPDETISTKVAADLAAWARSLAERRKRNVALAADAVLQSRAFTDREALEASPPLIDLVASDVSDLLTKLDGRTVTRFDGRTVVLATSAPQVVTLTMTRRQRVLSAIAHPQVAYLLFMLGILGITVEMWHPGAIAPGVVGGISLLLAFFAFQVLPVSTTGVLLILFGLGLLIVEIKVSSFGLLGLAGVLSLVAGSLMLPGDIPGIAPQPTMVIAVAVAVSAVLLFLGRLAVRATRQPPSTGLATMVGLRGQALASLSRDSAGQVAVRGEIWNARSDVPIAPGDSITIVGVQGLMLEVTPTRSGGEGASS
jgi:membrane-bound serine protease (ClpP class)